MSDAEQSRGSEAERAALTARHQIAVERLRDALRVEVAAFVSAEVERRLRARPHFFGRMAAGPRASLRTRVDADSDRAVAALAQPIADLRIYYGAETRPAAEEDAGFAKTVTEAAHAATRRLLGELAFPGDDKPDRADVTAVDLDAEYQLAFAPSAVLLAAWRAVRALDGVRNLLADGAATDSFELRWHLPERASTP